MPGAARCSAAAACVLFLAACSEWGLKGVDPGPPPPRRATVTETFVQAPLPKVDLLLVLDRTASMDQELTALVDAADLLGDQLEDAGVAWQMGVVGTEMSISEAGWLLGLPWVLTPSGDPGAHLDSVLAVPDGGTGEEAGIASAIRALELASPSLVNDGFRRPDASLHVVFVSDGDDESDAFLAGDPVQAMHERLAIEASNGLPATVSAVVGDVPGGCSSAFGSATAGTRYVHVAEGAGGEVVSICSTDFTPIVQALGDASIVLQSEFVLHDVPSSDVITVMVDGKTVMDWTLDAEIPAILFDAPPQAGAEVMVTYTVVVEG